MSGFLHCLPATQRRSTVKLLGEWNFSPPAADAAAPCGPRPAWLALLPRPACTHLHPAWNTDTAVQVTLHVYVCLKHQHSDMGCFTCICLPETPTQWFRLFYMYIYIYVCLKHQHCSTGYSTCMSAWNTNTVVWVILHVYVSRKYQHSGMGYFTCICLPETQHKMVELLHRSGWLYRSV